MAYRDFKMDDLERKFGISEIGNLKSKSFLLTLRYFLSRICQLFWGNFNLSLIFIKILRGVKQPLIDMQKSFFFLLFLKN
jgi:hypothetical protein